MIPVFLSIPAAVSSPSEKPKQPTAPKVLSSELLVYPMDGRYLGIQGLVVLELTTDGLNPKFVQVISAPPVLAPSAISFVQSWKFRKHTPTKLRVEIEYILVDPPAPTDEDPEEAPVKETLTLHLPTKVKVQSVIIPNDCAGLEVKSTTALPKSNKQ
ncbi:MAG: hypothetical protein HY914_05820 [Desulfomonile tiedjei]|nr:hypothetical protein [Desulfomonile tiedjei]